MHPAFMALRASITGALLLFSFPALALNCPADRIDEQVRVVSVSDGDTLRLADERRVRIIGINTPERAHQGRPAEPLADKAYAELEKLVRASNHRVSLRLGDEPHDRHGRLLAHVFLDNGQSVEAHMLDQGLAARVAIAPNIWGQECFAQAENAARMAGRGVWALPAWRNPPDTRNLPAQAGGFMLLQGRVERVGGSRHAQWINLEGGVALKIEHDLLPYFRDINLKSLEGKRIEARGWLTNPGGNSPRIRLTHPSMLRVVN